MNYLCLTQRAESKLSPEIKVRSVGEWWEAGDLFNYWNENIKLVEKVGYTVSSKIEAEPPVRIQRIYDLAAWQKFRMYVSSLYPIDREDIINSYAKRFYIAKVDGYPKIWLTGG